MRNGDFGLRIDHLSFDVHHSLLVTGHGLQAPGSWLLVLSFAEAPPRGRMSKRWGWADLSRRNPQGTKTEKKPVPFCLSRFC